VAVVARREAFHDSPMTTFASAGFSRRWICRIGATAPELDLVPSDALATISQCMLQD
jgi:hypothetical protein